MEKEIFEKKTESEISNELKEEKRPAWEILNEQKENILREIKENLDMLDTQILTPQLIYPNMEEYEVNNGVNNIMLSIEAIKNKYADNTWILEDTIKKSNEKGEELNFILKKGEKATKIGVEVKEVDKQDIVTGQWYKEKLDKPYTKNVNVYNLSQFKFAKNKYPQKTYVKNKQKDSIILTNDKIEELNKNTFEARLEKFFIEQKYNIKNKDEIREMNKKEVLKTIEESMDKSGKPHKEHYKLEYYSGKAMVKSKDTIKTSIIEKNMYKENKKEVKEKEIEK